MSPKPAEIRESATTPPATVRPKSRLTSAHRGIGPFALALLSIVLGVVAGVGALVLRVLIALCHNLLFLGRLSTQYDANVHTSAGPLGVAVVLAPAVGGIAVVFLVKNFAPEAKGHGVPEVMDAIYYNKGVIRPVVAGVKALASAISIGSGGSVGREGPIIQIGAAFGSWAGRTSRVSRWQIATLIAAGGGAGIASTFNTPIGGVLFAVEVLLHEVSVRTLVPVALATATATYVGHFLFGDHPAFVIPTLDVAASATTSLLPAYVCLGGLMALVSTLFIRALYGAEDLFERWIPKREYLRNVVGMMGVGLLAEGAMLAFGHYYIQGVGYATIMDILTGSLTSVGFLAVLFAGKLLATSLTLGSGASGGVFSPALFMGATSGAAFGLVVRGLFPGLHVDPAAFALAGMAGVVAGTTGAALTAIVMLFEMTLDYSVVLPMTLTVAVSYGLRRALNPDSIYTTKLRRRGHPMPWALQSNAHLVHHVTDLALETASVLPAETPGRDVDLDAQTAHVVLIRGGEVAGVLSRSWASAHRGAVEQAGALSDVARADWVTVPPTAAIFEVLARLRGAQARVAVVVDPAEAKATAHGVLGVITLAHLAEALADGMEIFGD